MSNTGNVQAARIRGNAMGGAKSARTAVKASEPLSPKKRKRTPSAVVKTRRKLQKLRDEHRRIFNSFRDGWISYNERQAMFQMVQSIFDKELATLPKEYADKEKDIYGAR